MGGWRRVVDGGWLVGARWRGGGPALSGPRRGSVAPGLREAAAGSGLLKTRSEWQWETQCGAAMRVCADGLTRKMSHSTLAGTLKITQDRSAGRAVSVYAAVLPHTRVPRRKALGVSSVPRRGQGRGQMGALLHNKAKRREKSYQEHGMGMPWTTQQQRGMRAPVRACVSARAGAYTPQNTRSSAISSPT